MSQLSPETKAAGKERIALHNLKAAPNSQRPRKRVGRGEGSGTGKTAGRGHKGAGARSGRKHNLAYEGGQNPIQIRMRKLRGPHMKKSMPFERFRTETQAVNVSSLNIFADGSKVDIDLLRQHSLIKKGPVPVKILAKGELERKLTVEAHAFSKAAKEKIEAAGGTAKVIEQEAKATEEGNTSE